MVIFLCCPPKWILSVFLFCFVFSSLKHLLFYLGCRVTFGLLKVFILLIFLPFLLHYGSMNWQPVVIWWRRLVSAAVRLRFELDLKQTDSQDQPVWKKKKKNYHQQKFFFFHACKLSILSMLFWGQFTVISQEAEMNTRSWFVILLTCSTDTV